MQKLNVFKCSSCGRKTESERKMIICFCGLPIYITKMNMIIKGENDDTSKNDTSKND